MGLSGTRNPKAPKMDCGGLLEGQIQLPDQLATLLERAREAHVPLQGTMGSTTGSRIQGAIGL